MKKLFFSVLIASVLVAMAKSGEYRNFSNHAGETTHARIVQFDAENDRVQLALKNHKKAWVQLSDLSEADQAYIREYNLEKTRLASAKAKEKEKTKPAPELSKGQVKEIAKQYFEAILNKDYAAWSELMLNTQGVSEEDFMTFYSHKKNIPSDWWRYSYGPVFGEIGHIEIRNIVDEYAVFLEIETLDDENDYRWDYLFICPDGKIKYDFHVRHPIYTASRTALQLLMNRENYRTSGPRYDAYTSHLINTGIPLFGFDRNASASDQLESLDKIVDWIRDNAYEWDSSEPKLFWPKKFNVSLVPY